jgi:hypothetical protein
MFVKKLTGETALRMAVGKKAYYVRFVALDKSIHSPQIPPKRVPLSAGQGTGSWNSSGHASQVKRESDSGLG